jgi:ornithine--oxo-acid transaminase
MRRAGGKFLVGRGEGRGTRWISDREIIERDVRYGGHHFKSLPVVLGRAEGVYCWDTEGRRYTDLLAGFATVSQGHSHPRLLEAMRDQLGKIAHTSRAFYTEPHGELAEYLTRLTGYERFIPMNTGESLPTRRRLQR